MRKRVARLGTAPMTPAREKQFGGMEFHEYYIRLRSNMSGQSAFLDMDPTSSKSTIYPQ
jgi:hypothetical protein